jgi:hypothetical protein
MKIIRIILLVLLALGLIAGTVLFIFFQTYDPDRYLPILTSKVSAYAGRPVSIGYVGPGLSWRGLSLDAGPVVVADNPAFTLQPFIEIDRIRMIPDWGALILRREIHFSRVFLESPQIHFIRSREGKINAESLARTGPQNSGALLPDTAATTAAALDRTGVPIARQAGGGNNRKYSLGPFDIKVIKIHDGAISFINQNQSAPLDIWLRNINGKIIGFSLDQPFTFYWNACFYSAQPNIHAGAQVTPDKNKRSVVFHGLDLEADLTRPDMDDLAGVSSLENVRSVFRDFLGVVQLDMSNFGLAAAKPIEAQGEINVTGGVIKNFNIMKMLLSRLPAAFGGKGNFGNLFNGPVKDKVQAENTVLEKAHAVFSIQDDTINISDSAVQTGFCEFTAKGSVGRGLNTDIRTVVHLSSDVSTALVQEFPGFKSLCDDSGRLAISAGLTGVFPHLKYKPDKDFRKKSREALWQEGGNILAVMLGGAASTSSVQETAGRDQAPKPKKKLRNIFKNLLQ